MTDFSFQHYLSQVASRLRHDLKGGLITLKMGLESLPDEESLKELLLEKSAELVDLSDKLILLLRMGELVRSEVRPTSLFQQIANQVEDRFPPLKVDLSTENCDKKWSVDPDAVTYAVLELAQNALLAKANTLKIKVEPDGRVFVSNDGEVLPSDLERLTQLGQSSWGRSGLGLSVVESCLQQHGGHYELGSAEDGSTQAVLTFRLDLTLD